MSTLIRPELSETNRYWIEKHRYYELKHFCLQYPLWRHAYNSLIDYFRFGMAAAELVLPLMFYGVWMRRGFKFEQDGTFTSQTFRGLFSRFRPTKK